MSDDKKDENIVSSNENEENLDKTENQPSVDDNISTSNDQKLDDSQNQEENSQNPEKSENSCTKPLAAVDVENPAKVMGINIIACAKIMGITPAAFIFKGIYCLTPANL